MRLRIFKERYTTVSSLTSFGTLVLYNLFLNDYQISACTMDCPWEDKEISREQDRMAVERLINDLQRNIQQYINEPHKATNCDNFKDKILDVEITEKDIKDWMIENKLRRIRNDFE
jgi:hypothetical protein